MPWSKKVEKTAQAIAHGWKPKGTAKGFSQDFAKKVVVEMNDEAKASTKKKKG